MGIQIQTADRATPHAAGTGASHPLWGRGFRPFLLGVGVYGLLVVAAWTAILRGALPAPAWLIPAWWHGHEDALRSRTAEA